MLRDVKARRDRIVAILQFIFRSYPDIYADVSKLNNDPCNIDEIEHLFDMKLANTIQSSNV